MDRHKSRACQIFWKCHESVFQGDYQRRVFFHTENRSRFVPSPHRQFFSKSYKHMNIHTHDTFWTYPTWWVSILSLQDRVCVVWVCKDSSRWWKEDKCWRIATNLRTSVVAQRRHLKKNVLMLSYPGAGGGGNHSSEISGNPYKKLEISYLVRLSQKSLFENEKSRTLNVEGIYSSILTFIQINSSLLGVDQPGSGMISHPLKLNIVLVIWTLGDDQ